MADDKPPPHASQEREQDTAAADLTAAYTAAHRAFMDHVKDCYACRRRGIDCYDVGALKARLHETRSASIAARTAAP
ncbi:hypothetical protein [Streptomyces niveus]|uniref:hypothetical protein n=1 Tax=Streptomyces niveus TaxID=193462 RepID=UPI00084BC659|nr:hypothetical protein [Streptomyces niveus]